MEAQLKDTIENLHKLFHDRMTLFESDLKNNPRTDIAAEFTTFRTFITEALKCLQQQVELLTQKVDQLEMHGRRKILLLHGVTEEKDEVLTQVVTNVVKQKLKIEGFSPDDIKRCHRMGRPTAPHRHRPILIKFKQLSIRDQIWFSKTNFKGSGITAAEFLTKSRHDVFIAAREKFGVNKCWTREGRIFVLGLDGERHHVSSLADLDKIAISISQDGTRSGVRATRAEKSKRNASSKK